ncbi:hypothetical protein FD46_GL001538 [Liquorilactobacillus oeni DSM 19972]|uniref:Uncharacterized protein n=2 Tax=Liquorilactobacillus oeni TaxID=303241 RepID=A0A0R1MH50_9LACO|nr:hypothetical protein FD46_GL001538 [Liquorilactobacillus oeni DSM 19972]
MCVIYASQILYFFWAFTHGTTANNINNISSLSGAVFALVTRVIKTVLMFCAVTSCVLAVTQFQKTGYLLRHIVGPVIVLIGLLLPMLFAPLVFLRFFFFLTGGIFALIYR